MADDDQLLRTMIARTMEAREAQDRVQATMRRIAEMLEAALAEIQLEADRRKVQDAATKAAIARFEQRLKALEDRQ